MKLLAADHTKVAYVNLDTGYSKVIHRGQGVYYGITWDDQKRLSLAVGNSLHLLSLNDASKQVTGYIQRGKDRSAAVLSSPHQILWKEGLLYVVDTGRNRLTVFDSNFNIVREVKATDADWDKFKGVQTGVHINSVSIDGNDLYILAHNADRSSYYNKYSISNYELIESKSLPSYMAHNIVKIDGRLLICDSKGCSLIDGFTDEVLWTSTHGGNLSRGLGVTATKIVVGKTPHEPVREKRAQCSGGAGIWILDRFTFEEIDYISIPALDHINELRILDVEDYAHTETILYSKQFEAK